MEVMLAIQTDTLPQTGLSYFAFRIAFQETLERICLAQQVGNYTAECFGFLTEVPFLRAVPPHVQLDLLGETWCKHASKEKFVANLVDESVIYSACETSARIVEQEPHVIARYLHGGPQQVSPKMRKQHPPPQQNPNGPQGPKRDGTGDASCCGIAPSARAGAAIV